MFASSDVVSSTPLNIQHKHARSSDRSKQRHSPWNNWQTTSLCASLSRNRIILLPGSTPRTFASPSMPQPRRKRPFLLLPSVKLCSSACWLFITLSMKSTHRNPVCDSTSYTCTLKGGLLRFKKEQEMWEFVHSVVCHSISTLIMAKNRRGLASPKWWRIYQVTWPTWHAVTHASHLL